MSASELVAVHSATIDSHAVADAKISSAILRQSLVRTVVKANAYLVHARASTAVIFFEVVANQAAADGAGHGRGSTAIAAADLVTQQTADHNAGNGTQAGTGIGVSLHHLDRIDYTVHGCITL